MTGISRLHCIQTTLKGAVCRGIQEPRLHAMLSTRANSPYGFGRAEECEPSANPITTHSRTHFGLTAVAAWEVQTSHEIDSICAKAKQNGGNCEELHRFPRLPGGATDTNWSTIPPGAQVTSSSRAKPYNRPNVHLLNRSTEENPATQCSVGYYSDTVFCRVLQPRYTKRVYLQCTLLSAVVLMEVLTALLYLLWGVGTTSVMCNRERNENRKQNLLHLCCRLQGSSICQHVFYTCAKFT